MADVALGLVDLGPTRVAAGGAGPTRFAATSTTADRVCGVLQIGRLRIALPLDVLREVIPCPAEFDALPAAAPGLVGAVRLRGRVVPVVDLRRILGGPATPDDAAQQQEQQVIALMRHDGRLLGLVAHAVCGLTLLRPGMLGVMESSAGNAATGALFFAGSFERAEDESAVSLLDPAALMRLPGLPLLRDAAEAGTAARASLAADRPVLLVRCGEIRLALEVVDVHATLPDVTLLPSSLDGTLCRGVVEYAGRRIPAVDALALLELGGLAPDQPCQALLLKFGAGQVALLVSSVVDIVRVPIADVAPLSPLAVRRVDAFAGSLRVVGHGEHLLLAAGALAGSAPLIALASLNTRLGPNNAPAAGVAARTGAASRPHEVAASRPQEVAAAEVTGTEVLTFDVGVEAATRLDQLIEVLAVPANVLRPVRAHPAAVGLFTHRGRSVTLFCLQTLLDPGRPPATTPAAEDAGRVLLVESDGVRLGFVVRAVLHIERALWEAPTAVGGARLAPGLVEVQGNGRRRTLRRVDLQTLGRSLLRPDAAAPPAPEERAQTVAAAAAAVVSVG